MKTNPLLESLKDFGLAENEAKVYFAALSLGPSTIQKIAQSAEIKRTTTYDIVNTLKQKGLMNIHVKGFKKKYSAEAPEKLESILEERKLRFKSLLPEFSALYNLQGGESFLKYYEGLEAVKGIYEGLIKDIKPGEDYLVMSNQDNWVKLDKEYFMDFLYRRAKLPIKIRMMFQDSEIARTWKKMERNFNSTVKILPKGTDLKTNLVITPQRVLIHQLSDPILGIVIENKSVIQMHKEMYEIIWKSLKEKKMNDK